MGLFNFTENQNDQQRKIIYDMAILSDNAQVGFAAQIKRFGAKDFWSAPGGKGGITFLIDKAGGGSTGASASDGSLAHLGKQPGSRQQVTVPSCMMYSRATCSFDDIKQWREAGERGNFFDVPLKNVQDAIMSFPRTFESLIANDTCDGRVASVSANSAQITSGGGTGDITVNTRQYCIRGNVLTVQRSSSFLSGVELYVTYSRGVGNGTITVTNQGTTNYTPQTNDILFVMEANNTLQLTSLNECVGRAAYPPRGLNTSPIDDPDYKAIVQNAQSNLIDLQKFRAAWRKLKTEGYTSADVELIEDAQSGLKTFVDICLMEYGHVDALNQELWGQTKLESSRIADAGWGYIEYVDGFPVHPNGMSPTNNLYILHIPGFICTWGEPEPFTSGVMGVYQSINNSQNFEAKFGRQVAFGVQNRFRQYRMQNVLGNTDADADLVDVT